jgi:hypothetical protein
MSTSPDTSKGGKYFRQDTAIRSDSPGLVLLKGLFWLALIAGAIVAAAMNYEILWDALAELVPTLLEVAEEALDTFFEKAVRLNPALAQMATAYTGFVLALIVLYLLVRKFIALYRRTGAAVDQLSGVYGNAWHDWTDERKMAVLLWWDALDTTNKVVAVVAMILIGIPLALLLSYLLGTAVATLL